MPLQHVDPATIAAWRWEGLITAIVAGMASAIPLAPVSPLLAVSSPVAIALVGAIAAWFWPVTRYRHLAYDVDEFGLLIQEGVVWRALTSLPRARIQHSDVSQGPLQRRYGIATLKLYTAGSRYTKIELEGLRHEDALALRDSLVKRNETSG
jgi:membrane protein YdbS with pleckstrin-like domain